MSQLKAQFILFEEALEELNVKGISIGGATVHLPDTPKVVRGRPENRLRGAAKRGRVRSSTIDKALGKDAEWVTINGVHVLVNKKTGEPIIGPDKIVSQKGTGQKNLDKVFKGKDHGFKVTDDDDDEKPGKSGKRKKKKKPSIRHEPTGLDIPLGGVGISAILAGLALFVEAATSLAITATAAVAGKLEAAIRQADEALGDWSID